MASAALVAAATVALSMPAVAVAAPSISPETAGEKRDAIREAAADEDKNAMADSLESDAKLLGDPVTMLESADARLEYAETERDVEACEKAIETTMVALDILHYYDAVSTGGATSRWLVIDPDLASGLISEAESKIEKAEELIEEIENDDLEGEDGAVAATGKPTKTKKKRDPAKPGTGLIIAGAALTGLGVAGLGIGVAGLATGSSKQKEVLTKVVPDQQDEVDQLDEEGKRANLMGIVGMAAGGGALVIGGTLLVLGVLKRKKAGNPPASARINVTPMFSRTTNGFAVQGRF